MRLSIIVELTNRSRILGCEKGRPYCRSVPWAMRAHWHLSAPWHLVTCNLYRHLTLWLNMVSDAITAGDISKHTNRVSATKPTSSNNMRICMGSHLRLPRVPAAFTHTILVHIIAIVNQTATWTFINNKHIHPGYLVPQKFRLTK